MSTFYLHIATPDCDVYSGQTEYLSLNTPDGREGFMRGALPRVLVMSSGRIEITVGNEKRVFDGAEGIVSVTKDGVTVLTSSCVDVNNDSAEEDESQLSDEHRSGYVKARLMSSIHKSRETPQND